MWILLLCSVTALAAFLERAFHIHRANVAVGEFLRGLANLIARRDYGEAVRECAATPGPAARVAHAVLLRHEATRDELRAIAGEAARLEVPDLERGLPLLSTVAYVAPLIGLLGTVLGLLDAFLAVSAQGGYATASEMAGGAFQSLVTSATGIAIAIPAYVAYSYLSARVDGLLRDMERTGIEVVTMVADARSRQEKPS